MANISIIRSVLSSWTSSQTQPVLFVEIRKVLSKLSKEKGCEAIGEWIRSCENHLYWRTTTMFSGNGKVMWAKVSSFMSHIVNKHSELSDSLFDRCFHGLICICWQLVGIGLLHFFIGVIARVWRAFDF